MQHEPPSTRNRFLRLLSEYEPALRRLTSVYTDSVPDREDLFQEIAVALWRAMPAFRGDASERTWLYRIAHNVAISFSTRTRKRHRREAPLAETWDVACESARADQSLVREEQWARLIEAIRDLPLRDRQIVALHLEGLSSTEMEQISGDSAGAIAVRLTRIRGKLRKRLQGIEETSSHV